MLEAVSHSLERTHLGRHDFDWLPPRYRAIRWTVAGGIWTGMVSGVAALSWFAHFNIALFGKGLAVLATGGYVAGDRAARAVMRGRLKKLAQGAVDLQRLPSEPDGELVHVVGRVRLRTPLAGFVATTERAAYRRVLISLDTYRVVHEAAEDFWLVADGSEPVLIEAAQSRLLVADPNPQWYAPDSEVARAVEALPLPTELDRTMQRRSERRQKGKKLGRVRVGETLLREGDEVEVVGYKSRTVDLTVATRLERDTPYRATLRAGKSLPLLIAPRTS
ncbi:MAG: hypothetical protein JWN44_264 [Myxococcales bacterium]|nr:hypothetical protein [Myxococcales bacterium]